MIIPVAIIVSIMIIVVFLKSITRVKSYEKLIVSSSGSIDKVIDSGFNFVSPLSDTHKIDCRKRRVNLPEVGTISSDGDSILMSDFYAIVSVSDAEKVFKNKSAIESKVSYELQDILKKTVKNSSTETTRVDEIASMAESKLKQEEDNLGIEVNAVKPGEIRQE